MNLSPEQLQAEAALQLFRLDEVDLARYASHFFSLQAMAVPLCIEDNLAAWGREAKQILLTVGPDGLPALSPWATAYCTVCLNHRLATSSEALALHLTRACALHWLTSLMQL